MGLHRNHYLYLARATKKGTLAGLVRRGRVASDVTTILGGTRDLTGDGTATWSSAPARAGALLPGRRWAWFGRPRPVPGVPLGRLSLAPMSAGTAPDLVGRGRQRSACGRLAERPDQPAPDAGQQPRQAGIVQVLDVGDWNGDGRGDMITRQTGGDSLVLRPGSATASSATACDGATAGSRSPAWPPSAT